MHRCVAAICYKNRYGHIIRMFNGCIDTSAKDAPTRIGRLLFTMNIEAVYQRYPDTQDAPENMPGPIGDDGRSTALSMAANYRYTFRLADAGAHSLVQGYKSLTCPRYQCSEGDVPESDLFKALNDAIGEVAGAYIESRPEYETAAWG